MPSSPTNITLKAFVSIGTLINNNINTNSTLCELTTLSRTYSKDIWEYQQDAFPGYKCMVFSSRNSTTGQLSSVSSDIIALIFNIVKKCITLSESLLQPYNTPQYTNNIIAEFFNLTTGMTFGNFVSNGPISLPEWITFYDIDGNKITIWLSDTAFQDLYDEYEIHIIPPINPIDDFFNSYSQNIQALSNRTDSALLQDIQNVTNGNPQTYLRSIDIPYVDMYFPTHSVISSWAAVIYGKAGDNIDLIKDAIITYISENSSHTLEEWKTILPYLFERTEFYMLPRWDKLSIINNTNMSSLYASILNVQNNITFFKNAVSIFSEGDVTNSLSIIPVDFKAIIVLSMGNPTNAVGRKFLEEIFPDYIPVNTLSTDFNRMTLKTKEWSSMLKTALIIAETAIVSTVVPNQYKRIIRNNVLYISFIYDNSTYLIAAKSNQFYNI